ncbi:MAG: type I DNA topoisomerase [Chloroflexi bacterium]|nr:type I DNA topoisomerase [Chloroflexota bacterium]
MVRAKAKKLVIVESPAKARTVERILGAPFLVKASIGHIRDLPKSQLGVDVDHDFAPHYVIPEEKQKVVTELSQAASGASAIYLATDPDREGEAISWHLVQAMKTGDQPVHRVVFHEITKDAVEEAFRHPRSIDMSLVDAQQARRILDRLVGYRISPILWKKVRRGLSAGRVQSVALRLIVEREREIQAFVPIEYWTIKAELAKGPDSPTFTALLVSQWGSRKRISLPDEKVTRSVVEGLQGAQYTVAAVKRQESKRQPTPPFITSTLQQEAYRKLGFSAQRTMTLAQQLYEGLPLGDQGSVGLITYMRTDSTRVSAGAVAEARDYIAQKYGPDYLPPSARAFVTKVKGAQEAHEAIRPTSVFREPDALKSHLNRDQLRLYQLIWKRMVASQMAAAVMDNVSVDIKAEAKSGKYLLRATALSVKIPGFLALYSEGKDEEEEDSKQSLPPLAEKEDLSLVKLHPEQHFTKPPARYTDATLVKSLEDNGIGRPSTYAPIIAILQQRDYVTREEGRFHPTPLGTLISDLLSQHFPQIVDIGFTAHMEAELDSVARGERPWVKAVGDFYPSLQAAVQKASAEMEKVKVADEPAGEDCPECGRPMVIKRGRYGQFMACSGFPQCRYKATAAMERVAPDGEVCPECGRPMVIKHGRYGQFIACSGYPECRYTKRNERSLGVVCPQCGGDIVEKVTKKKRHFYGCKNYPQCTFSLWQRPLSDPCPRCGGLLVQQGKNGERCVACSYTSQVREKERIGA